MTYLSAVPAQEYKDRFALETFVETGCYRGDGLLQARNIGFDQSNLYSCDVQEEAVTLCRETFPQATIDQVDSIAFLIGLLPKIQGPTLFWLDAHFPEKHGGTDQPHTKMPLFQELELIKTLKPNLARDVIICDDIHILADPANPTYRREKIPAEVADYYFTTADWQALTQTFADTHEFVALDSAGGGVGIFYPRLKILTIDTVQGIGDVFWAYQKLAPYCDLINFNILGSADLDVQRRAIPFIKLLPKAGTVKFKIVPGDDYEAAARCNKRIVDVMDGCIYAVNHPLENGIRLDQIDDGEVEWGVQFNVNPEPQFRGPGFPCMFVSGSSRHYHDKFSPEQWADLYVGLNLKLPPILVGAEYDNWMLELVSDELGKRGIEASTFIARPAEHVIRLLRDASLMIGFQSGLNVIANNYGVPVIMVDFNHLRSMAKTWCRPGVPFWGFVFEDGVDGIINGLQEQGFRSEQYEAL